MSYKKGFLKNFAKFARKYICRGLFLNKVKGWKPAILWKGDSGADVFLLILANFQEHLFCRASANSCFWFMLSKQFKLNYSEQNYSTFTHTLFSYDQCSTFESITLINVSESEVFSRWYFVKKLFLKFRKIHRKTHSKIHSVFLWILRNF